MLDTYTEIFIDTDSIQYWIEKFLGDDFKNNEIRIIGREGMHCTGESKMFAEIIVDEPLTRKELIDKTVKEHNRMNICCFYVDDVVSAAVKEGVLKGDCFCVYYQW